MSARHGRARHSAHQRTTSNHPQESRRPVSEKESGWRWLRKKEGITSARCVASGGRDWGLRGAVDCVIPMLAGPLQPIIHAALDTKRPPIYAPEVVRSAGDGCSADCDSVKPTVCDWRCGRARWHFQRVVVGKTTCASVHAHIGVSTSLWFMFIRAMMMPQSRVSLTLIFFFYMYHYFQAAITF